MKLDNIKRVFCENTGGGTLVDFIELNDGRILGINEDFVVLYSSLDHFYSDHSADAVHQFIDLRG